ncbi:MAG: hypothetical protein MUF23_14915 [Pirellula sp.]|nr:hypothetical protein [Pirellula sp.]
MARCTIGGAVFIPKGFKPLAGGKPHSHWGATTGNGFGTGFTPEGIEARSLVLWAAMPPALTRLVGARNPVVRYRDHRLMAQTPVGAYKQ